MKTIINRPEPVVATITLEMTLEELTDITYWLGQEAGGFPIYESLIKTWREASGFHSRSVPPKPQAVRYGHDGEPK